MVDLHKKLKTPQGKWHNLNICKHNHIDVLPDSDAALKGINDEGLERQRFLQSCFGRFLLMDRYMQFSGTLVHQVLLRELQHDGPNDEMRFMLGGHSVRFSKIEFCLITGLRFGVVPSTAQYMASANGIHDRYFHGRSVVKIEAVKELVRIAQFQEQYDGVKLCLLLILNAFLHGSGERGDVPIWQLRLVEDLDAFDAFPWGSLIYRRSISSFRGALLVHRAIFEQGQQVRKKSKHNNEGSYNLYGFAYALQIFAFEVIPELVRLYTRRTANELFPRILKYCFSFRRNLTYGEVLHIIDGSTYALERMDPTPEEVGRGYFQGILGDVQDLNTVPGCMTRDPPNISAPKTNYNSTDTDTDIVAKKRKLPVEAALVEEPYLEPKKCTFKPLKLKDMGHCREAKQSFDEETVRMRNGKNLVEASPAVEKADLTPKKSKEISIDGGPNLLEHIPLSPPSKDIMSKKRKTSVEAALVEQPRQASKRCTMQHLDQNMCYHPSEGSISPSLDQCPTSQENIQSSSLTKDTEPTGKTSLHPSLSDPSVASGFSSHFSGDNSSSHVDQQTKVSPPTLLEQHESVSAPDEGIAGSPISSLEDAMAFFTEIDSVLNKSPKDLLDSSSHTTLATSEDINQAKCLLQQCLSMNFELIVNSSKRDQVKSSLEELFLKVGHFPSDLLKMVRTFCVNFLRNIDAYSNCKEHVKKADKRKEERITLKVEMAKNRSLFNIVKEEIKIAANEIEELEKKMTEEKKYKMDLEEQAKKLAELTRKLKEDFDQLNVDFENLEKEKENSEVIIADIETQWDELRRKIADFL